MNKNKKIIQEKDKEIEELKLKIETLTKKNESLKKELNYDPDDEYIDVDEIKAPRKQKTEDDLEEEKHEWEIENDSLRRKNEMLEAQLDTQVENKTSEYRIKLKAVEAQLKLQKTEYENSDKITNVKHRELLAEQERKLNKKINELDGKIIELKAELRGEGSRVDFAEEELKEQKKQCKLLIQTIQAMGLKLTGSGDDALEIIETLREIKGEENE